jgi:hypothetical protein
MTAEELQKQNKQNESALKMRVMKESAAQMEKYKEYIGPLRESFERRKKPLDWMAMAVTLNNLKNLGEDLEMVEATQSINVGTFIQHGYDLVTAIYPNLVANNVSSTQPLTSRSGEVWFYDLQYQDAKGLTGQNSAVLSSTRGVRVDKHYATEYLDQTPTGNVDGANAAFSGTIPNAPLRVNAGLDFFTATDGVESFTVDPTDFAVLVGDQGGSGTLNTTSGAYTLAFNTAPVVGSTLIATGKVDFEALAGAGQGRTKISLTSVPIYSQKHQLITDYTLDAEHDLSRNFGMNISDELIKGNASIIRAELDQLIMDEIKTAAKDTSQSAGSVTWDAAVPAGIDQIQHFRTILTMFNNQSNSIYGATHMVHGNFIITGNNISTVVETLPEYQSNPGNGSELTNSGPYVGGTIKNFIHIKNPEFDDDEWVCGNKGNTAFNTGYILAPYKPLMVTGPISDVTNPFSVTRGLWLDAGRLVVNALFYSYGRATNVNF